MQSAKPPPLFSPETSPLKTSQLQKVFLWNKATAPFICSRLTETKWSVKLCFWFYCALNIQSGGYVRITSLININIITIIM